MYSRKWTGIVLIMAFALLLAACGGDDGPQEPEAANGDPVDAPPVVSGDLSQSITSTDGSITVSYPADWAAEAQPGQVSLFNSQDLMDNPPGETIGEGQLVGSVAATPLQGAVELGLDAGASPLEVLEVLYGPVEDPNLTIQEPQSFETNGLQAASIFGSFAMEGQAADTLVIIVRTDTGYGILNFIGATGSIQVYEATAREIAGSVQFAPIEPEG